MFVVVGTWLDGWMDVREVLGCPLFLPFGARLRSGSLREWLMTHPQKEVGASEDDTGDDRNRSFSLEVSLPLVALT